MNSHTDPSGNAPVPPVDPQTMNEEEEVLDNLVPTQQQKTKGMAIHLSALIGYVIPFGNLIAPIVLWQIFGKESAFLEGNGKEAVNFQITVALATVICFILMFVGIGFLLLPIVGIAALVFTIIAGIKANEGVVYRYPVSIRFIR